MWIFWSVFRNYRLIWVRWSYIVNVLSYACSQLPLRLTDIWGIAIFTANLIHNIVIGKIVIHIFMSLNKTLQIVESTISLNKLRIINRSRYWFWYFLDIGKHYDFFIIITEITIGINMISGSRYVFLCTNNLTFSLILSKINCRG